MHITMNNVELKEAVELWLSNEGLTPDSYNIEVKFVAGRSGNEGRIEIDAQKKVSAILEPVNKNVEDNSETINEEVEPVPIEDEPSKSTVASLFN